MYDNEERNRINETKLSFRQYLLPANTAQLNAPQSSYEKISLNILGAVGDRCVPLQRKGIMQQIINRYSRSPLMLRPDNIYLNFWELLVLLIIIYYILEVGLLVAFKQAFWQDEYQKLLGLQIFFVIVLLTDIVISPLKTYYDEGLLINQIPQILGKYLKIQFWIDLIGLIVIIVPLCVGSLQSNYGKILWFLKLYTARRINSSLERETQLYISLNTFYLIIKLIVFCYFYAHFMGLGFYMVSLWIYNNNYYGPSTPYLCWIYNSWAYYQMVLLLPWTQMYAYIMYYSIAVVTTIAYGDITPKNPIECIYTIFALIIVTIIFGYLLTEILRLLINVFSYSFQRRFHHFELNTKLKLLFVSRMTQIQIKAHTEQIDKQEQYRNRQIQDKIMRFLPPDALYGLLLVIYRDFLVQLGLKFAADSPEKALRPSDFKSQFLDNLMKDIRQQRHYIGDVFYKQKDLFDEKPSSHCAYFYTNTSNANSVMLGIGKLALLRGGQLDTQKNILQKSFQLAKAKNIFGHVQFLTGSGRSHWAICLQNCVLFVIPRSSLLQHYSLMNLQEREILFAHKEKIDYLNCYICGKDHNFKRCRLVFPFSDDVQEVNQQAKRIGKLRSLQRTRLKTMSSWIIFKQIRDSKVKISKQYRQNLMLNKVNHELFVQYELDESEQSDDEFDYALREAEIIIDKVYNQQVEDMGYAVQQETLQCFYNFNTYKVSGNIKFVSKGYRDYNMAKKKNQNN